MHRFIFAVLAAAVLLGGLAPPASIAAERIFTFPDPALTIVRRFEVPRIRMEDSGPAPLALINFPTSYSAGTQIRVQGYVAALGGISGVVTIAAGSDSFQISASGTFDQTLTLSASTDRLSISGATTTSAEFTSIIVDVMNCPS